MDFNLDHTIALLERTPRLLTAWCDGLPDAWLHATEGPGSWTPLDLFGHWLHGEEEDWIPRARLLLEHGEARPFEPFDPEGFRVRYSPLTASERLARFAELRADNLAALRAMRLSPADLERRGTHPALGAVTLRELLGAWTVHDLTHLAQLARVQARAYVAQTGPWRAFLPSAIRD